MKKTFLILGLLAATPAAPAAAAISSVNYARNFMYKYCKNPTMQLPGGESSSLASQKYVLGMIDFLNQNKTAFADTVSSDRISSVGYLQESLKKIQSSDVCCPTGYFNVTDGKCANCGIYVPRGTCPVNFREIPIQNVSLPGAGENCPLGTESYSTLPDGCAGIGVDQVSICDPLPQIAAAGKVGKAPQNKPNNRSYVAYGTGCKITSDGPVCDDPIMYLEAHCSASTTWPADNWEEFGQYCWVRIIGVKTATFGFITSQSGPWITSSNYSNNNGCNSFCGYAFSINSNVWSLTHTTLPNLLFSFGDNL